MLMILEDSEQAGDGLMKRSDFWSWRIRRY